MGRRRAARHRLLPDHHRPLRHRPGAAPGGGAASSATLRPASTGSAAPCSTSAQCSAASSAARSWCPGRRMQFLGTKGRLEVEIPFNAPNDVPCRLFVYEGPGLGLAVAETIELAGLRPVRRAWATRSPPHPGRHAAAGAARGQPGQHAGDRRRVPRRRARQLGSTLSAATRR